MWNWAWKPVIRDLSPSVEPAALRRAFEEEGFAADGSHDGCLLLRRPGSIWTFNGERAPLAVELRGTVVVIRYDTRWMLGDTGDLAQLLDRLIARVVQQAATGGERQKR